RLSFRSLLLRVTCTLSLHDALPICGLIMSIAHYFDTMDYGSAPEADGEARAWLKRHEATFGHFIAGKFAAPASGKHLATIEPATDRKSTRLNSSHVSISYAVFCLNK